MAAQAQTEMTLEEIIERLPESHRARRDYEEMDKQCKSLAAHNWENIDDCVCEIMHKFCPDGHVDGHEIITNFIMGLLGGSFTEDALAHAVEKPK